MRLDYDLNVGALYISLTDRAVALTREIDNNTFVDLDEAGAVVGIEVISIGHPWRLRDVLRDYSIPDDEAAQLRVYFMGTAEAPVAEATALSIERNAPVLVPTPA
jgi:uncharacterized protein YuzE